jgi:hypothetical protein
MASLIRFAMADQGPSPQLLEAALKRFTLEQVLAIQPERLRSPDAAYSIGVVPARLWVYWSTTSNVEMLLSPFLDISNGHTYASGHPT